MRSPPKVMRGCGQPSCSRAALNSFLVCSILWYLAASSGVMVGAGVSIGVGSGATFPGVDFPPGVTLPPFFGAYIQRGKCTQAFTMTS